METDLETNLESLKSVITQRTGLAIRNESVDEFRATIVSRIEENRLKGVDDYCSLLQSPGPASEREWKRLVSQLTIGESYFFRDPDQFKLLRERILPELITKRQNRRAFRIWSAGCATGEEAYSLAILIHEALPRKHDWKITILATDIDEAAIEKAKQGIFGAWSFRRVAPEVKTAYFERTNAGWQIADNIRRMVDFRVGNLLAAHADSAHDTEPMDLILCRNVFIYFDKEAVSRALDVLCCRLRENGYLVTGHGELLGQSLGSRGLRVKVHPESVVYQKAGRELVASPEEAPASKRQLPPIAMSPSPWPLQRRARNVRPVPVPAEVAAQKPGRDQGIPEVIKEARAVFLRGDYRSTIEIAEKLLKHDPNHLEALSLIARSHANLGLYETATEACRRMISIRVDWAPAYFLLAQVAEARGDYQEAKILLKKVIYLDPGFVAAYVELSGLYDRENDTKRAHLMRRSAVEILKSLPHGESIEPYDQTTAGELIEYFGNEIQ